MAVVRDKDLQRELNVPQIYSAQTGAPGATTDLAHGYHVGDIWINTSNAIYMCAVQTTGAATWVQLG